MSLTFVGRSILFAVLAALAAYGGWAWAVPLARYFVAAQDSTQMDLRIAKRTLAYRLERDVPMTFVLSQPAEELKVIAHVAVTSPPADVAGASYTLHFALFDVQGVQVAEYERALVSGRGGGYLPDGRARRFYRSSEAHIWGQDQLVIRSDVPLTRVEVTLRDSDPMVVGVDARVYERRPVSAGDGRAVFLRRSREERAALTAFSPFPPEMLSASEITHLASNLWRPIGPVGIEGREYDALVIYEADRAAEEAES